MAVEMRVSAGLETGPQGAISESGVSNPIITPLCVALTRPETEADVPASGAEFNVDIRVS